MNGRLAFGIDFSFLLSNSSMCNREEGALLETAACFAEALIKRVLRFSILIRRVTVPTIILVEKYIGASFTVTPTIKELIHIHKHSPSLLLFVFKVPFCIFLCFLRGIFSRGKEETFVIIGGSVSHFRHVLCPDLYPSSVHVLFYCALRTAEIQNFFYMPTREKFPFFLGKTVPSFQP